MKKLLTAIAATALIGTPAFAADMAVKMPVKAPPPAPAPVYSWTGFYIGGNVGYGWGEIKTDVDPGPSATAFVNLLPQTLDPKPKGFLGGGQFGYNWQNGWLVLGAEFDFQGADLNGTIVESPIIQNNGTPFPGAGNNITISRKLDWFGTLRGRLGTTAIDPRLLVYVTGGLAFGKVEGTANTDFRPVGTEQYPASVSDTKTGWVIGGGAEWAFLNNWSVKAEYLFVDLGNTSVTAAPVPPLPPFSVTYTFHTKLNVARLGVNYKF